MVKSGSSIYDPKFVGGMFDRMSKTYGSANLITSFGFTSRWRRQCIDKLPVEKENYLCLDLMSGMGESWGFIQKKLGLSGQIVAIDISEEMNQKAAQHIKRLKNRNIKLQPNDILKNNIPSESADIIISTFGIKTFNKKQQATLAKEINRILKPGGYFTMIEISQPNILILRGLYMFYLKNIIPFIGKTFLGNSKDYRMLGTYCEEFKNCYFFHNCLINQQLDSSFKKYFFGCATGVFGIKRA